MLCYHWGWQFSLRELFENNTNPHSLRITEIRRSWKRHDDSKWSTRSPSWVQQAERGFLSDVRMNFTKLARRHIGVIIATIVHTIMPLKYYKVSFHFRWKTSVKSLKQTKKKKKKKKESNIFFSQMRIKWGKNSISNERDPKNWK